MEKIPFDPHAWASRTPTASERKTSSPVVNTGDRADDVEIVLQRLEAGHIDITSGYDNWRDIGFAFADEFGENGRDYFHRVSRFHPEYDERKTDEQYDKCLRAHGTGVTLNTFFHKAQEAGISLRTHQGEYATSAKNTKSADTPSAHIAETADSAQKPPDDDGDEPLPVFSPAVRDRLPAPLDTIAAQSTSDEDCDMLILGALCVLSSCLPHISGVYHGRRVYPNFFLFVTAGASAGKGRLTLCRHLAEAIDDDLHQQCDEEEKEYKRKMQEYKSAKNKSGLEIPEEPPMLMHYIPANSSATVVYQILNDNGGSGMMFESEGDTLANIFASDYGKYSDGFRKAFHHENISFARRKDRERVFIKEPKLSALLTGTPNQILNLITDAENGLFSRFAFYCLQTELVWLSPFAYKDEVTQDDFFLELGAGVKDLYDILKAGKDLRFSLTEEQEQDFDGRFSDSQMALYNQYGDAIVASIRRLGLITYRIAMILSALRLTEDGDFESDIVCLDQDYQTAAAICEVLVAHMARVYKMLPETPVAIKAKRSDKPKVYQRFYDALPDTFDRKTYSDVAVSLGLNPRSVDRTISQWCDEGRLERTAHGQYAKVR